MFKLDSYIAPLLIGYIDKYVKLNREDFQMSLWGGDVLLNKLELRLDVIEDLLKFPISLRSGWIHELRVHVPWTHLYSEPVIITVNTIECTVMLKNSDSNSDSGNPSCKHPNTMLNISKIKNFPLVEGQHDLPAPSYLQSLLNRIINNINITVNNLILKFVDDDIVLSLNIKSADCYCTNAKWNKSFIEMVPEDLVIRRVLEIHDLTLCLDQRNASGKIEHYQAPVLYKCVLAARLAMAYENLYSKLPCLTKLNIVCDMLNVSLTDIQLPMIKRLINLILSFYYGSLNVDNCSWEADKESENEQVNEFGKIGEKTNQNWVSWAWSYVPSVLPYNQDSDLDIQWEDTKSDEHAILIVGFLIKCMKIGLKHNIVTRTKEHFGFERMSFVPYLVMKLKKLSLDMRFQGHNFTDIQLGISSLRSYFHSNHLTELPDEKDDESMIIQFFVGGANGDSPEANCNQFHRSLFDDYYENESFPVLEDEHILMFSEEYAQQNYNFFWMNYFFTIQNPKGEGPDSSSLSVLDFEERSLCRFVLGKSELTFTTRFLAMIKHINSLFSEYESSALSQKDGLGETKLNETDDLLRLENDVVTCKYLVSLISPTIFIYPEDLIFSEQKNYLNQNSSVPVIMTTCERLCFSFSLPFYPKLLSRSCSVLKNPSEQAMKNCHSFLLVKVDKFSAHLQLMECHGALKHCLIYLSSLKLQKKSLLHHEFWNNLLKPKSDWLWEAEGLTFSMTKSQLLIVSYVLGSWFFSSTNHKTFYELSLKDDVFHGKNQTASLSLELTIPSFEIHYLETAAVYAFSGCITNVLVLMLGYKNGKQFLLPLLYGPLDLSNVCTGSYFYSDTLKLPPKASTGDLISFSCQMKKNKLDNVYEGVFIKMLGMSVLVDPSICDWLSYIPKEMKDTREENSSTDNSSNLHGDLLNSSLFGSGSENHIKERKVFTSSSCNSCNTSKWPDTDQLQWHSYFSTIYMLLKCLEVEVTVGNSCLFISSQHIHPTIPATVDIPVMLHSLFIKGSLPNVLVLVFPTVTIRSMGIQLGESLPPIPMISQEYSTAGEKLPWNVVFGGMSIYSIHECQKVIFFLKSITISSTVALDIRYDGQIIRSTLDSAHLSLCLHCDTDTINIFLSFEQLLLFGCLFENLKTAMTYNKETLQCIDRLLNLPKSVSMKNNAVITLPEKSQNSSNVLSFSTYHDYVNISESLSDDISIDMKDKSSPNEDKLSLWVQFTISKSILEFDLKENAVLNFEFADITNSFDMHESFTKFKSKINFICVKTSFKHQGYQETVLLSEICIPEHLIFMLSSRMNSTESTAYVQSKGHLASPTNETEFLNFAFTRINENSSLDKFVNSYKGKRSNFHNDVAHVNITHLDEVCITIQPFIIVANSKLMSTLLELHKMVNNFILPFGCASSSQSTASTFNSSNLPLVHLNMKGLYVLARTKDTNNFIFSKAINEMKKEIIEDTLIFHIASIKVVPYADNPLPRLVVDKDLYIKAVHSKAFGPLPGYPMENRQYQINMMGLIFASTNWESISETSDLNSGSFLANNVQNPALEWNFNLRPSNTFYVCPIASISGIKVIFAPPIIVRDDTHEKIVCGHSIEINALSELEVFLTMTQMQLLGKIFCEMSDVYSELKMNFSMQSKEATNVVSMPSIVPFDLLVAGIRLNIIMFLSDHSSYVNYKQSLCSIISQPYLIIKYDELNLVSKFEISFYDACLKCGDMPSHASTHLGFNFCPSYLDFLEFIMETKQGKSDAVTGVLSSLLTCTISDFHSDKVKVIVKVERPVRLSYTGEQHGIILNFFTELWKLADMLKVKKDTSFNSEHITFDLWPANIFTTQKKFMWLESVSLNTDQFVLRWMIKFGENQDTLQVSFKSFNFHVDFQELNGKVSCNTRLTNLTSAVSPKGIMFRVFGPSMLESKLSFNTYLVSTLPSVVITSIDINLKSDYLIFQFSKDSISSLNFVICYIISLLQEGSSTDGGTVIECKFEDTHIDFENDLESRRFVLHEEGQCLPACGEIMFQMSLFHSTITWTYPEPRSISKLTVVPLPSNFDKDIIKSIDEPFTVISCLLQYSLDGGNSFRDYASFEVGGLLSCNIFLPSVNDCNFAMSCIWRILVDTEELKSMANIDYVQNLLRTKEIASSLLLVSCLKINSSIIPYHVPKLTLSASFEKVQAILRFMGQKLRDGLGNQSYDTLSDHRVAVLTFDKSSVIVQILLNNSSAIRINVMSGLECQLLEYKRLTWLKVIQDVDFAVIVLLDKMNSNVEVICTVNKCHLVLGQEVAHTLSIILSMWKDDTPHIASYYLISNNTQEEIYFGQVGTGEMLSLPSHGLHQYFWTHLNKRKELWLGATKNQKEIETVINLEHMPSIKNLSPAFERTLFAHSVGDFKIKISGNLTLGSKLSFATFIKVEFMGGSILKLLNPMELLPSFVIHKELLSTRISISFDSTDTWSEEIVLGEFSKKHLLNVKGNNGQISLWCEVLFSNELNECLVVLSPIFVLRSHYPVKLLMNINSKEFHKDLQVTVEEKGKMTYFHCCNIFPFIITFQHMPEMSASNPAMNISFEMMNEIISKSFEKDIDIEQVILDWNAGNIDFRDHWPYNAIDESVLSLTQIESMNSSINDNCNEFIEHIPNMRLSINLSKYLNYSNTVLIELIPEWILVNETGLDFIISNCNFSESWIFPSSRSLVLPKLVQFIISILVGDVKHSSEVVTLTSDEVSSPYQPYDDLHLSIEGHAVLTIPISRHKKIIQQICLTIHSTWKHNMRILTIRERFVFVNNIPYFVKLQCCISSIDQAQMKINESTQACIDMSKNKSAVAKPLITWDFYGNENSLFQTLFVISLSLTCAEGISNVEFSSPLCLELASQTSYHNIVIPCNRAKSNDEELFDQIPCSVTLHTEKCLSYLVLAYEPYAFVNVHNNCCFSIYLASPQSFEKSEIIPQAVVKAFSSGIFCPPRNSKSITIFPFSILIGNCEASSDVIWSPLIEICENTSSIIKLGNYDMKVETEVMYFEIHLNFSPVMRASVQEVKRIIHNISDQQILPKRNLKAIPPRQISCAPTNKFYGLNVNISVLCQNMFWFLQDDTNDEFCNENAHSFSKCFLLIAMDDLSFFFKSILDNKSTQLLHQLEISIGDLQIDNKLYDNGSFDFPVILLRSQEETSYNKCQRINILSDVLKCPSDSAFLKTSCTFVVKPKFQMLDVTLSLATAAICLEDTLIFRLIEYIHSLIPKWKSSQLDLNLEPYSQIPLDVKLISNDFANPVRLRKLVIEPVKILISIHASLKIFVALDSTPMNFGKLEKADICLTRQQLSKLITIHYASSALLQTGVIIGSLEILGNPTGFVRNISNGVYDMIYLPYNGLALGPASCITGFSNGIKSIIKHFSAGTLTSLSNFASGISRNMERLSMDEDHIGRFDRMRRKNPQGLTQGFFGGLSRFGLSLLGAIAGIADQPLQMFVNPENSDLSISSKAKGLVSGLGKGLIGMVAKPIGGAAELVSMTSIGIMHGTGLIKIYHQRDYKLQTKNQFQYNFLNQVALTKKHLLKDQNEELLFCLDVYNMNCNVDCSIILTSTIIHVWNCSDNFLLCSYPVTDVLLSIDHNLNELLFFVVLKEYHQPPYLIQDPENDSMTKRIVGSLTKSCYSDGMESTSNLSQSEWNYFTKPKLKYRFRFYDKFEANGLLYLFDYAFCREDANHFVA